MARDVEKLSKCVTSLRSHQTAASTRGSIYGDRDEGSEKCHGNSSISSPRICAGDQKKTLLELLCPQSAKIDAANKICVGPAEFFFIILL